MKKICFLTLMFFLFPIMVFADSITKLEVTNGILSREFDSNNNTYSVILNEDETELKLNYELKDKDATVSMSGETYRNDLENIATLNITNSDGTKETYTFYLEKEENVTAVFNETSLVNTLETPKEIPHLKLYIGLGCMIIILILFKVIILGFKTHKKQKNS